MSAALQAAKLAIVDAVGNVGPGESGRSTCPICGTTLHWSRSRSGRTIWICCKSEGCVYDEEEVNPAAPWPGVSSHKADRHA